jgi:hypothetical protein
MSETYQAVSDLRAKIATIQKLHDDLWEMDRKIIANLNAKLKKAEFELEHLEVETTSSKPGSRRWICLSGCNYSDPRHEYTDADWFKSDINDTTGPYLKKIKLVEEKFHNPNYDENAACKKCGHPYYRHFDTYANMEPVGCKYCECDEFEPI